MKCEVCKKATATLYRYVGGFDKQVYICAPCFQNAGTIRKGNFSDARSDALLDGLAKALMKLRPAEEDYFETQSVKSRGLVCSNCGFEFEEYYDKGRFGCVKCYDVFHAQIRSVVYKIHGCVRHNGSRPT